MRRRIFRFWPVFGILLLVLVGYLTSPYGSQRVTYTPAAKECLEGGTNSPWKACIYQAPQGTNGEIAYYFHGKDRDEQSWNDDTYFTTQIQKYWEQKRIVPPIVVSVSYGRFWLLAPKGAGSHTGLLESFLDEVIPTIEQKIGEPKSRIIAGTSMGGLNALIAGLRAPERFRKIVTMCPPIFSVTPFSGWSAIKEFFYRTGANPKSIVAVFGLARRYATNDAEWDLIAPLKLLAESDPKKTPEIYLTSGLYDRYGIFEGAEKFAKRAEERHFRLQWRPVYGNHCALDITSLAEAFTTSR
jgi:pimeloyl-ACP methyl ester carboxylesterase